MSHWAASDRRKLAPVAECDLQDYEELLPLDVRQQLRLPQQTQRRLPKGLKPTATPIVGPLKTLPITSTRNDLLASIESDPVIGETSFAENCLVLGIHLTIHRHIHTHTHSKCRSFNKVLPGDWGLDKGARDLKLQYFRANYK